MLRPIFQLNLPEFVRTKLQSLGYEYIEDIENLLPNLEDATPQLKAIVAENKIADRISWINSPPEIISAATLWHTEFSNPPVAIFHEGLHKLLDGGLPIGRITEICGPPGSGKTQMCLQFCVDVQMPVCLGGSAGDALFISTDFGFRIERLRQIVQASIKHCYKLQEFKINQKDLKNFTAESLLNGISVIQLHDVGKFVQTVRNLKEFFNTNENVKLVIVDSFSLPLVVGIEDLVVRSKVISEVLDLFLEYAVKYKVAVVLTNQLMTIVNGNSKVLKPSLGEGFGHRLHVRLLLDDGKIYLTKSINRPQLFTHFQITQDGIR